MCSVLIPFLGDRDGVCWGGEIGRLRVIGTFTDNVGGYVTHCHKLEHEDHAMMFNFVVQP